MCGQVLVKSYSKLLKCQSLAGIQIDRVRRWPISSNSSFTSESFFSFQTKIKKKQTIIIERCHINSSGGNYL